MSYLVVTIAALVASLLSFYSGFGLGTLLTPAFIFFFPVETAILCTAIVHFTNNVVKVSLVGKFADWSVYIRFGVPALFAAFFGAAALGLLAGQNEITSYQIGGHTAVVTPIKLTVGLLVFFFALFELVPKLREKTFDKKWLPLGGVLSGFFGGLSGHQGAMRSAFLAKTGLDKEAFIGTNALIALTVDSVRVTTYVGTMLITGSSVTIGDGAWPLILTAIAAAMTGSLIGKRTLTKVTMSSVRTVTGIMLLGIAALLITGVV